MSDRLKMLWTYAGFASLAEFAREAKIKEVTAQKHAQRDSIPPKAAAKYLNAAKETGADLNWLLTGRGTPPQLYSRSGAPLQEVEIASPSETRQFDISPSALVPLWELVHGPGGAVLIEKTVNLMPSPNELRHITNAFAVRMWDDSNAPWLRRGVTLFIDPTQIGIDGQWCLFAARTPEITKTLAIPRVGVLLGATATGWRIRQGDTRTTLPFADWPLSWKIAFIRQ